MQRTLISGKRRGLTLICKIQIVKSFIIPIFLSKAVARTAPEDQVRARLYGEKLSQVKGSPTLSHVFLHFLTKGNKKLAGENGDPTNRITLF